MAKKDDDYEVGYKKPPKETQFKPGQSGNPKGRPKERKNLKTELLEELHERIAVKEGGAHRKVSKQRAMLKSLTAMAMQGDTRAATVIVNMVYRLLDQDEDDVKTADLSDEDLALLNDFEIRPRPQARVRRRTPPPTMKDSKDD